ncbi:hypothetical protein O181_105698 [Austropuccinia psidii MF-1]|uniref:Uncharacterized protein n=1 Tax=Austropuccinia psidii MF-1 TaxID=1389203 RepID=A0A9Q3PL90_9BASI|nr:hypothetical protein [Austropuccinia psidii MF-1]
MNHTRNESLSQKTPLQDISQSQQITNLKFQLESREKAFKSLLAKIQDFELQTKPTLKANLGKKSGELTCRQTVSTPLLATTPKRHPNQLQMAEVPEAFIKTKVTGFMRRVDKEICQAEKENGKPLQRHIQKEPSKPMESICNRVPSVAFLPDVSRSLWGRQHPDERLSDENISQKYWDKIVVPYDLSHEIEVGDDNESGAGSTSEVKSDEEDVEISEEDMDNINGGQGQEEYPSFFIDRDTEMQVEPLLLCLAREMLGFQMNVQVGKALFLLVRNFAHVLDSLVRLTKLCFDVKKVVYNGKMNPTIILGIMK